MKRVFIIAQVFLFLFRHGMARDSQPYQGDRTVPGTVVAKVKAGKSISMLNQLSAAPGHNLPISAIGKIFQATEHPDLSRFYKIVFPKSIPPEEFAAGIFDSHIFEYVEPTYISYVEGTIPNDTLVSRQSHLEQIGLFMGWDIQKGSESTVIAIVDNGTDFHHPDLAANIRINLVEASGSAGVDDDGNGYTDDFYGWDFGDNDNNPGHGTDPSGIAVHGTHTAGIASAVTDNITGVAGAGWNCSILPIKVAADNDTYQISSGYEGIVYAADNGAHIINLSWGRSGAYSQFEQDIIDYAAHRGCIIIAAGGNTNMNANFYPASYVHVVAVAAVNDRDEKASYATYGTFIDLSAPGGDKSTGRPGILSTIPVDRGSYGEMSGSSMASPVVAGVLGLMKSQFPTFNALQLKRQLILTADPIDPVNPGYTNLLGAGRVNAYRALTEDVQDEIPANIEFFKAAVSDAVWGNGNFLIERGEEIGLDLWFRNYSISPASFLEVTLTTSDDQIRITEGYSRLNQIPPDTVFAVHNILRFAISSNAEPHVAQLLCQHRTDQGKVGSDTISVMIGKRAVLLVDDDDGYRNVEGFYSTALSSLNVPFLIWDHSRLGTPPARTLSHFPTVIWFCEWAFPSLSPEDRMALQDYLNQGGHLFLSGQDIGWDLADPGGDGNNQFSESSVDFYQHYLHSDYREDHSRSALVQGIPGTPGQGLEFTIYQPDIPPHFQFPDWLEPMPDAVSCFRYDSDRGAGVFFEKSHRVLNLGFGFEAADASRNADPTAPSRIRRELMERILNAMGPMLHTPLADSETSPDSICFTVDLSPRVSDINSLSLFWKTDAMSDYEESPMSPVSLSQFQKFIRLNSPVGEVRYYFGMKSPYYQHTLPVTGEAAPFIFLLGSDQTAPTILFSPLPDIFLQKASRPIRVFVEDNLAVAPNSVWLHWAAATGADSLPLTLAEPHWFSGAIPAGIPVGDTVRYYVSAYDAATVPNRAVSDIQSYAVGFENFEHGLTLWRSDSDSWALDDNEAFSGSYCISTGPGAPYPNDSNASLYADGAIPRSSLYQFVLHFRTKYDIEAGVDFGFTEISLDGGANWQFIGEALSGTQDDWRQVFVDLDPFAGVGDDSLLLRFRLATDSSQTRPMAGWFIDDICIQSRAASEIVEGKSASHAPVQSLRIRPNVPNPFNAVTVIEIEASLPGDARLAVYNLRGQVVVSIPVNIVAPGVHKIFWDGRDTHGQSCGSGVYFAQVQMHQANRLMRSNTVKLIYLR